MRCHLSRAACSGFAACSCAPGKAVYNGPVVSDPRHLTERHPTGLGRFFRRGVCRLRRRKMRVRAETPGPPAFGKEIALAARGLAAVQTPNSKRGVGLWFLRLNRTAARTQAFR